MVGYFAIILCSQINYFENDFGLLNQVIVPLFSGAIACWIRLVIAIMLDEEGDDDTAKHVLKKYSWVYMLIGALAGIVAVNLLNPKGSFAQVLTISVLAGLSGITYLLRSSMVDSIFEDKILKNVKNTTLSKHAGLTEQVKEMDEIPPSELAKMVSETYNIATIVTDDDSFDDNDEVQGKSGSETQTLSTNDYKNSNKGDKDES